MSWFKEHQTDILTGAGIVGMGTAGVLAAINTPKAKEALDKRREELEVDKLPPLEFIKAAWKYYIVPIATFAGGTTCVILAHVGDKKAAAGYAAAYAASEVAIAECKDKITEVVGEKKAREIQDKIVEKHDVENPITEIHTTGTGDHLMRFDFNGYTFRSTVQEVESRINDVNEAINRGETMSVADLCYYFGKESTEMDSSYVWDVNRNGIIHVDKNGGITPEGEPYIIWVFTNRPIYDGYYN